MKRIVLVIICLACTALAFGGGKTESSEYVNEDLGFAFEYPADYVEEPVLFPNEITRLAKPRRTPALRRWPRRGVLGCFLPYNSVQLSE